MDSAKTGGLIRRLRQEKGLTQKMLAERIGVSDKAVSKWETGRGAPDIGLVNALSAVLNVSAERLLCGEMPGELPEGGNMKKTKYFYCPGCGSIAAVSGGMEISCCGRKLAALTPAKPDEEHGLNVEQVEDEWFLTADHPMTREHFITFIAFAMGDRVQLIRQYPEWDLQQRTPEKHGRLLWHCNQHCLFEINI